MNIQLKTGKTISVSVYEFYFMLPDEDVEKFYESCVADDEGILIDNPFSNKAYNGRIEYEEDFAEEDLDIENSI